MAATRPSPPQRIGGAPRAMRGRVRQLTAAFALIIAMCAAPAAFAQQATRIGYIDMQRLLDNAPQVLAGKEALRREFAQRDAELKAQELRLADLRAREQRDAAILPREAAQALTREIETLDRSIKRLRDKLREDLSARTSAELNQRWPEIHDAVIEYARENGYDLVVESPVIYASASIDITDRVIERLQRKQTELGRQP
jgi:outer membrane protein